MKDETKTIALRRIPLTGYTIVRADELQRFENDVVTLKECINTLEREYKRLRISQEIRSKQIGSLQRRINVLTGDIPAPLCLKCGKPKIAGGIQWLDHADCYAGLKDKNNLKSEI